MRTVKTARPGRRAFEIREMFILVDTKSLDSKKRITIGERLQKLISGKMKVDSYQIFIGKEGDILLRPTVSVPSSEAWVYRNPEVMGKIRKGMEEAREGKLEQVDDLEGFLRDL